jgi:hypothetical protein
MSKPNKIKVIRKLCDTQLNFNTGFIDNDQMTIVGIASTTFLSANCFCMYGNRKLGDNISANAMVLGSPGCCGPAGTGSHWDEGERDFRHAGGGAASAAAGGNFIATRIVNFNDSTAWCVKNLGVGSTNSMFCNISDNSYVLADAGPSGTAGGHGYRASHNSSAPGAPGTEATASPLSNTFVSSLFDYRNVCCVQGCPGSTTSDCRIGPGPDFLGCGGPSGFQNSNCCTVGVLTSFYTQRYQGNNGRCRAGWVHVSSTGRDDKVL